MHIYLANVGTNASHGKLISPLFEDGTFEFLPIPEGNRRLDESTKAVHYRDLRSHYDPSQDLLPYVPKQMWDTACHNDPEFKTSTHGDGGTNGRSSRRSPSSERGNSLLFLARLHEYPEGAGAGRSGFYLQRRAPCGSCRILDTNLQGTGEVLQQRARYQG